jgi:hypothetical protein
MLAPQLLLLHFTTQVGIILAVITQEALTHMLTLVVAQRLTHMLTLEQVGTEHSITHTQTRTINTHIRFLETLGITQAGMSLLTTAQQEILRQRYQRHTTLRTSRQETHFTTQVTQRTRDIVIQKLSLQ